MGQAVDGGDELPVCEVARRAEDHHRARLGHALPLQSFAERIHRARMILLDVYPYKCERVRPVA